jgi:hypothetical protein
MTFGLDSETAIAPIDPASKNASEMFVHDFRRRLSATRRRRYCPCSRAGRSTARRPRPWNGRLD